MIETDEYVVCSFWRTNNGKEIIHVYGPYGVGEPGKSRAMTGRFNILQDHKRYHPTGPMPVVKVVKASVEPIPSQYELDCISSGVPIIPN